MVISVGTADSTLNKQCKFSSSVSKNGILLFYGSSVSIFRINTDNI